MKKLLGCWFADLDEMWSRWDGVGPEFIEINEDLTPADPASDRRICDVQYPSYFFTGPYSLLEIQSMHEPSAFINRLKKNLKQRHSLAKRCNTEAFRVYERDIPEFPYIIDVYGNQAVIYDKAAGPHVARLPAPDVVVAATAEALELSAARLHFKQRRRQEGTGQYEKLDQHHELLKIKEGRAQFLVNLTDYLDTGLFLDHRPLRQQFASSDWTGRRFLNLFCYTGSISVAAAFAGASCVSVDLSNTYLEWAEKNFQVNSFDIKAHEFIRDNALAFVERAPLAPARFDVIFLDPPTFSNSKKMAGSFDIQRDHLRLIHNVMRFLREDGVLYFSTNRQRFALAEELSQNYAVRDISLATIPDDFRNKKIHRCFTLRKIVN